MPLFGRRAARHEGQDAGGEQDEGSELARHALRRGWQPLGPAPFGELDPLVHDALRARHGLLGYQPLGGTPGGIEYRPAFGGQFPRDFASPFSPREFRWAHAWTVMNTKFPAAVCALLLGAPLPEAAIGLRPYYSVMHEQPEISIGDTDFATRFEVRGAEPDRVRALLVPAALNRLMERDDWTVILHGTAVLAVCFSPFADGPDVERRLDLLADLVAQFPRETRPETSGVPPREGPRARPWSDPEPGEAASSDTSLEFRIAPVEWAKHAGGGAHPGSAPASASSGDDVTAAGPEGAPGIGGGAARKSDGLSVPLRAGSALAAPAARTTGKETTGRVRDARGRFVTDAQRPSSGTPSR